MLMGVCNRTSKGLVGETIETNFFTLPTADADSATVNRGSYVDIDVLSGDVQGDLAMVLIEVMRQPAHGTAVVMPATPFANSRIRYTPSNYLGQDFFTYRLRDSRLWPSNEARVDITILDAAPGSYANGYARRGTLRVSGAMLPDGSSYTSLRVAFDITDEALKQAGSGGVMQTVQGYDLRFESLSGTVLPYKLTASYDRAAGRMQGVVVMPASSASDDAIYVYAGRTGVSSSQQNVAVVNAVKASQGQLDLEAAIAADPTLYTGVSVLTAAGSNGGPLAIPMVVGPVPKGSSVALSVADLKGYDPDGNTITFSGATNGLRGTATVAFAGSTIVYKHTADSLDSDLFSYSITDGNLFDFAKVKVLFDDSVAPGTTFELLDAKSELFTSGDNFITTSSPIQPDAGDLLLLRLSTRWNVATSHSAPTGNLVLTTGWTQIGSKVEIVGSSQYVTTTLWYAVAGANPTAQDVIGHSVNNTTQQRQEIFRIVGARGANPIRQSKFVALATGTDISATFDSTPLRDSVVMAFFAQWGTLSALSPTSGFTETSDDIVNAGGLRFHSQYEPAQIAPANHTETVTYVGSSGAAKNLLLVEIACSDDPVVFVPITAMAALEAAQEDTNAATTSLTTGTVTPDDDALIIEVFRTIDATNVSHTADDTLDGNLGGWTLAAGLGVRDGTTGRYTRQTIRWTQGSNPKDADGGTITATASVAADIKELETYHLTGHFRGAPIVQAVSANGTGTSISTTFDNTPDPTSLIISFFWQEGVSASIAGQSGYSSVVTSDIGSGLTGATYLTQQLLGDGSTPISKTIGVSGLTGSKPKVMHSFEVKAAGNADPFVPPTDIVPSITTDPIPVNSNAVAGYIICRLTPNNSFTNAGNWTVSSTTGLDSTKLQFVKNGLETQLQAKVALASMVGNHAITVQYEGDLVSLTKDLSIRIAAQSATRFDLIFANDTTNGWNGAFPSGLTWGSGAGHTDVDLDRIMRCRTKSPGVVCRLDWVQGFTQNGRSSQDPSPLSAGFDLRQDARLLDYGSGHYARANANNSLGITLAYRPFPAGIKGTHTYVTKGFTGNMANGDFVNAGTPYGYGASMDTLAEWRDGIREMYDAAGNGKFDAVWGADLGRIASRMQSNCPGRYMILRPWWEFNITNASQIGAELTAMRSHHLQWLELASDCDLVRAAMKRFSDLAHNTWSGFLTHFNPLSRNNVRGSFGIKDLLEAGVWDCVGPDSYDNECTIGAAWPTGTNAERWIAQNSDGQSGIPSSWKSPNTIENWNAKQADASNTTRVTNPGDMYAWLYWVQDHQSTNERLAVGEWGNTYAEVNKKTGGGDNDTYIENMFNFFKDNAQYMGYETIFNSNTDKHTLDYPTGGYWRNAADKYHELWTGHL